MQEGVGEREDELAHSAAFGDGVGRRNAWEDKSTAARVFASSSRSRSSTPSSWADSLASQPPLSSVLLQHEVTEALRSPVMPKPHQHRHVNTQERQQGKGGLSLTDLHTPLAPGASSMVLNLEGFEVSERGWLIILSTAALITHSCAWLKPSTDMFNEITCNDIAFTLPSRSTQVSVALALLTPSFFMPICVIDTHRSSWMLPY